MTKKDIALASKYFQVGLHTHSHPTNADLLTRSQSYQEYITNFNYLERIIGYPPKKAAFPCGRYNTETLDVLCQIGIDEAFLSQPSDPFTFMSLSVIGRTDCNLFNFS